MYFIEKIKKVYKGEKITIFVDMDGVIADYNFNCTLDFKTKRPIITNINTLKKISELKNVKMYILSICKKGEEIEEKNIWLDKYAPFFKKERRIIIAKDASSKLTSKELKCAFLKSHIENNRNKVIVIDDDNEILDYLLKNIKNIDLYQDSSIVD